MPDVTINLNDKTSSITRGNTNTYNVKAQIAIDDVTFHHCVRLDNF